VSQPLSGRHLSIVAVSHTLPVNPGERWAVVVHNDDHNPFGVVHHLLGKIFDLDAATAHAHTLAIHYNGSSVVGTYDDRETAETITSQLVRVGLRAELRKGVHELQESFSAHQVDGGVRVMVSTEFARGWEPAFHVLESVYRRNSLVLGLRWPRPVVTRRAFLRKMFPDVSGSRWRSAMFRRRHRKVLADRALIDRVWGQWINAKSRTLKPAEVDEWIVVFGQIRALHLLLRKATPAHIQTLSYIQSSLVTALDPKAVMSPHDQPALANSQRCNTSQ